MINKYKLIALDLDGTLLNSDKQISEKNKLAIKRAQENGVKVVISTGRVYVGAKPFAIEVGINEPLIACNGSIIKDITTNETLYVNPMRLEDSIEVVKLCKEYEVYFHLFIDDTLYTERLENSSLAYWNKNLQISEEQRIHIVVVENVLEHLKNVMGNILKLIVISKDIEKLAELRSRVSEINTIDIVSSGYDNFEVINQGVSKGGAVEFLAKKFGIDKDEIMSFGDNENDISMIEYAGTGVAMGNGLEELKDIADFVTLGNDDDGVADFLNKIYK